MGQDNDDAIGPDAPEAWSGGKRIVIVGASLAGLRTLESLRRLGCTDSIVMVGDESHRPYNRPPLSKGILTGEVPTEQLLLRSAEDPGPTAWVLGDPAVESDLAGGTVRLKGGTEIGFDILVVATGLRPRRLSLPGPTRGRHSLRGLDDAESLRDALSSTPRVAIVGAGFVGCEVASAARSLGCGAVVVAPEQVPLERVLGLAAGRLFQARHLAHGVDFRLGTVPVALEGDERVSSVLLADGDVLTVDLMIEAVGSEPNTGWLAGNGLDITDGVPCDGRLRAVGQERVVAVGDVARFPLPLVGGLAVRIEHWQMAVDSARRAARTVMGMLAGAELDDEPFAPLPSFWSDQYGQRLQSFGVPSFGLDDVRVMVGDSDAPRLLGYYDDAGLVGVAALGSTMAELAEPRKELQRRAAG